MDNSAACLFDGPRLVAAVENERLSRIKNDGAFPTRAIAACLETAGITLAEVDRVAVYWQPWRVGTRAWGTLRKMMGSRVARRAVAARARAMFSRAAGDHDDAAQGRWADLFRVRRRIEEALGEGLCAEIRFYDHHLAHQLYAEAMRDWDELASLSYDGGGEAASTVVSVVRSGERRTLSVHRWPNSLGHFYSTFTGYLGFQMLEGEYKMMGLAPYGSPRFASALEEEILRLEPEGRYRLNTRLCDYHAALVGRFHPRLEALFGPPRKPNEPPSEAHVDLAASVQHVFERAQAHVLSPLAHVAPDLRRLVISGGCALNVTANGRLLEKGLFDEIIIPPAPHDAGCAIGAAMADLRARGVGVDRASVRTPYLGPRYEDRRIAEAVRREVGCDLTPMGEQDLVDATAAILAEGLVVAWYQGRSELGPRALGARSFLADPRRDEIREELNRKIKKRELFRPFAPSVVEEAAGEFFELAQPSPYMNIVARVRPEARSRIPAVTHVDGTARVHTVSAAANPRYHALLRRFGELTGVPVLLNTSFNIQEPIVETPEEALATFRASGVDALVIGPYVVRREQLA